MELTDAAWEAPYSSRVDCLTNYSHSEALGSTSSSWSRELRELDARAQVWIRANALGFSAGASGLSIMSAHVSQRSIDSMLGGTISAMVIGARRRDPGQAAD